MRKDDELKISVGGNHICNSNNNKSVKYDCRQKLSFDSHLNIVCKNVIHKYALARACNNIYQQKLTIIMTAFTLCQFGCCPLV